MQGCCVVPVLLPIQVFTQTSVLSGAVSCPLFVSASSLNLNPVFSKSSLSGLDFDGVNARLVCCVGPVLLPIQALTQASALSGAGSLS
jgi:hypothetical protein